MYYELSGASQDCQAILIAQIGAPLDLADARSELSATLSAGEQFAS